MVDESNQRFLSREQNYLGILGCAKFFLNFLNYARIVFLSTFKPSSDIKAGHVIMEFCVYQDLSSHQQSSVYLPF